MKNRPPTLRRIAALLACAIALPLTALADHHKGGGKSEKGQKLEQSIAELEKHAAEYGKKGQKDRANELKKRIGKMREMQKRLKAEHAEHKHEGDHDHDHDHAKKDGDEKKECCGKCGGKGKKAGDAKECPAAKAGDKECCGKCGGKGKKAADAKECPAAKPCDKKDCDKKPCDGKACDKKPCDGAKPACGKDDCKCPAGGCAKGGCKCAECGKGAKSKEEHLRLALQHLRAAGLGDIAARIEGQQKQRAGRAGAADKRIGQAIGGLRKDVETLKAEVAKLKAACAPKCEEKPAEPKKEAAPQKKKQEQQKKKEREERKKPSKDKKKNVLVFA